MFVKEKSSPLIKILNLSHQCPHKTVNGAVKVDTVVYVVRMGQS